MYIASISCVYLEFQAFEDEFDIPDAIHLLSTLKSFCESLPAADNVESTVEPESRSPSPKSPSKRGRKSGFRFSANQKDRRNTNAINNPIFMHNLEVLSIVSFIFDVYIPCIFHVYLHFIHILDIYFAHLLFCLQLYVASTTESRRQHLPLKELDTRV